MALVLAGLLAAALTALILRLSHKVMLRDGFTLAVIAYTVLVLVTVLITG